MTRSDQSPRPSAPQAEEHLRVAPEDESFEHQLKRLVAEREARRAERPGLYR